MEDQKNNNQRLETLYFQVSDLWKRLCEEHSILFDLTCDEYMFLLQSDLENLENAIDEKKHVLEKINSLDELRTKLIKKVGEVFPSNKSIKSVNELLIVMDKYEQINNQKHLYRFNKILIDIIEKIQNQNKKNQLYINKAVSALKDIREDATGVKAYSTYNSNGASKDLNEFPKKGK